MSSASGRLPTPVTWTRSVTVCHSTRVRTTSTDVVSLVGRTPTPLCRPSHPYRRNYGVGPVSLHLGRYSRRGGVWSPSFTLVSVSTTKSVERIVLKGILLYIRESLYPNLIEMYVCHSKGVRYVPESCPSLVVDMLRT